MRADLENREHQGLIVRHGHGLKSFCFSRLAATPPRRSDLRRPSLKGTLHRDAFGGSIPNVKISFRYLGSDPTAAMLRVCPHSASQGCHQRLDRVNRRLDLSLVQ